MRPADLTTDSFANYPPEAKALAVRHIDLLRQLPIAFLPLLLREIIAYDWKFPVERRELDQQVEFLARQGTTQLNSLTAPFAGLKVDEKLTQLDWVNVPAEFSEQLSAHLWATNQINAFRQASIDYVQKLNLAKADVAPPVPRLAMVLVGKGAETAREPLFRKLKPSGTLFTNVDASEGLASFFAVLEKRATAHPAEFAHWYIDGGNLETQKPAWTCVSYNALQPVSKALLEKMTRVMQPGGGGPEKLRSELQRMQPSDLGFGSGESPVLSRFQLSLLTEGSGTQLFSTTFVQWTAREALRRAQPWTLLARFQPRRRESVVGRPGSNADQLDADGALVDAEMGAYYTWINQQRLANSKDAGFIAWHEGHGQAVALGPAFRASTVQAGTTKLTDILARFS